MRRAAVRTTVPLAVAAACVVALMAYRTTMPSGGPPADAAHRSPVPAHSPPPTAPARFVDVTDEAGIEFMHTCCVEGDYYLPEEEGSGGAFFDYDNDGDVDIYLVQSGLIGTDNADYRNRLYRNDGTGRFVDVSSASGADVPGYGMGCAAADYDNDGDADLFVTRLGPNVLLENNGDGTFSDATTRAGVGDEGFGTDSAFFDYDRDGLLDLYVVNYVDWSATREHRCYDPGGIPDYCSPSTYDSPAGDHLYRNLGDGRFENVTESAGIASARGNGLGVITVDFNGDGWVDIYVANDATPAFLWVNQQDGTFVDEALFAGAAFNSDGVAIAGMGVVAEDLDSDGDFDLLVTNIHDQAHLCLRNEGGSFEDVSHQWGFDGWGVPYTGFGVAMLDQDHDGTLEVFIANGAVNRLLEPLAKDNPYGEPNQFVRRDKDGKYRDQSASAGSALRVAEMSRGAILGDYDNDGDLDVLVTNNRGPAQLLRNENASDNAWTTVALTAGTGGASAINARIEIEAAGRTWRREVRPHVGYLGSNDPRVHIGLAEAKVIERLTVTWLGGTRETWTALPVNAHLRLGQGKAPDFRAHPGAVPDGTTP